MTNTINPQWSEIPPYALWLFSLAALGWIIGPIVGYYLGLRSQRIQREAIAKEAAKAVVDREKAEFGVFFREQKDLIPKRGVREFYNRTKPAIRAAVCRLGHFLSGEERDRLEALRNKYEDIKTEDLDPLNESAFGEGVARPLHKLAGIEFQTPDKVVEHYFDEFYKFSA